jgi:hypothetical protein
MAGVRMEQIVVDSGGSNYEGILYGRDRYGNVYEYIRGENGEGWRRLVMQLVEVTSHPEEVKKG